MNGTSTGGSNDVVFTSSRDTDFTNFLGNGETTAAAAGNWYGMRFDLEGCERPGYGYTGSFQPISSVEYGKVKYGKVGVAIEDYCAPTIKNTTFSSILNERDIYLDSTDVFLPRGYWVNGVCDSIFVEAPVQWNLQGGTDVVASTGGTRDGWAGVTGKGDLVVEGNLVTTGSTAAGDTVYFRPENVTSPGSSGAGNDWGGVMLTNDSSLRFANLGYAATPLVMVFPDSLTGIERSRIHHFKDSGIWVYRSMGQGAVIDSCVIDRGSDLHEDLGTTGILLDATAHAVVANNQVLLHGLDTEEGGTGIAVLWGESFCETTGVDDRQLTLYKNFVMGSGQSLDDAPYTGVKLDWVCGSDERNIDVLENWIEDWKYAGMEYVQTADVQVNCNLVVQSDRAVDMYRDSDPTGTSVRFKDNTLRALTPDTTLFALRTNDAAKVKLGPAQADRGTNWLWVNHFDTKFLYETDGGATDTLDARNNVWATDSLGTLLVLADSLKIKSRLAPSGYLIKITGFIDDPADPCEVTRPPNAPEDEEFSRTFLQGPGEATPDGDLALATAELGLPQKLEVGSPYPNPGSRGMSLQLAVPKDRTGTYVLEVFDVTGRRVLESRREVAAPGRYPIAWSARDGQGRQVGVGVYFVRLRGPGGFVETRKVTVIR